MIVDVHAHCVPAALLETLRRDGARHGVELVEENGSLSAVVGGRARVGPIRPELIDIETRVALMRDTGVDVQVLSPWTRLLGYDLPPAVAARYARLHNDALAATVAQNPTRFLGLCTVPLQDPGAAAAELRYAIDRLGFVGVEIGTTVEGVELSDPALEPFWQAAAELSCLVLLHPYRSLAGRDLKAYRIVNLVGNPAETTIAIAHLVLGGVLERFPDIGVCAVHGGGFVPFQAGRFDRGYVATPDVVAGALSGPPHESLKRLYYDTVVHSQLALEFLVGFAGHERVLLGSDYPFAMGDPDPVGTVRSAPGLDDAQRAAIVGGNATRLFAKVAPTRSQVGAG